MEYETTFKLKTIYARNILNKLHSFNGIVYTLTDNLCDNNIGWFLIEPIQTNQGYLYKVIRYVLKDELSPESIK